MVKFKGYDKDGNVLYEDCVVHYFDDLPMKGLGKSMEGVNINEPVIISQSAALDDVIWGYTKAEIERRAFELGANIMQMELPMKKASDELKIQIWFSKRSTPNHSHLSPAISDR